MMCWNRGAAGLVGAFALLGVTLGCGEASTPATEKFSVEDLTPDYEPPHGGVLFNLTNDFSVHGELVVTEAEDTVLFYVLGPTPQTPVVTNGVALVLETAEGEKRIPMKAVGDNKNEFEIAMADLPVASIKELKGSVEVTVLEDVYKADLKQE